MKLVSFKSNSKIVIYHLLSNNDVCHRLHFSVAHKAISCRKRFRYLYSSFKNIIVSLYERIVISHYNAVCRVASKIFKLFCFRKGNCLDAFFLYYTFLLSFSLLSIVIVYFLKHVKANSTDCDEKDTYLQMFASYFIALSLVLLSFSDKEHFFAE